MEELMTILIEYVSIWMPSVVSILGIVTTILVALNKTKEAWNKMKEDTDYKDVKAKLTAVANENSEIVRCNKLLLDEITKIKDYADHKAKEE